MSRLYLLAALAAAFLLVPAAQALANPEVEILTVGSGSGKVVGVAPFTGEGPEGPVSCEWDGSTEAQSGTCNTEASLLEVPLYAVKVGHEAEEGSLFTGWKVEGGTPEGCQEENSGAGDCGVLSFGEKIIVKATFEPSPGVPLTIDHSGAGSGQVNCVVGGGAEEDKPCEESYEAGTELELIAEAHEGSQFAGFENGTHDADGCSTSPCGPFTLEEESTLDANFELETRELTVAETGPGSVYVECEEGSGFETCANPLSELDYGTEIQVAANPDTGAETTHFEGTGSASGCEAAGSPCTFEITEDSSATAEFTYEEESLAIAKTGSGTGTVQCEVDGGGLEACPTTALYGSTVKVVASADSGSELGSVSGTGSASGCTTSPCEFSLQAGSEVTVEFKLESEDAFSVTKTGSGTGTVQCEVDGGGLEACGSALHGSTIKLVASADSGSELVSVSGAGSAAGCTASGCEFTLEEASSAAVEFTLETESLAVSKSGAGAVQCEVDGGGLEACPSSADYGSAIKVVATPDTGSELASLSGTGSASGCTTSPCEFTIAEASEVSVEFVLETRSLTIAKTGSGTGTVQCEVDGGGLEACPASTDYGSAIKLFASADSGSELVSVSGTGSASGCAASPCEFTLEADSEVTVEFALENRSLTIAETGAGTGAVECEVDGGGLEPCPISVSNGSSVKVVASADAGSELGAISGTGSASGCAASPCEFTLAEDSEVSVEFKSRSSLMTERSGSGSGSFRCDTGSGPEPCAASYPQGTALTVIAVSAASSDFTGWGGGCDSVSVNRCQVTLDADRTVEAVFTLKKLTLSVSRAGTGTGAVTSSPVGIDCGSSCSHSYDYGTEVALSASPGPISDFSGWSGCDEAIGDWCKVRIEAAGSVTATFTQRTKALSLETVGPGLGSISCDGGPCASRYPEGATVTLHANPDAGAFFFGWAGAGCTGGGDCVVTLDRDTTVAAAFEANPSASPAAAADQGKRSPCAKPARRAKQLSGRAKRLRRNAVKLARNGHRGRAKPLRRKAKGFAKQAHRLSRAAKRCRARRSRGGA
jgi:hypothetical protein